MAWHTALNTAVSFVNNTNGQAYAVESGPSPLVQSVGLTFQNSVSIRAGGPLLGGVIQNFTEAMTVATLSDGHQVIPRVLVASQEAITELRTDGGGDFKAPRSRRSATAARTARVAMGGCYGEHP